MPYFTTSQEWFEQSALLLQARPSTTRIVTKYSLLHSRPTARNASRKVTSSKPVGTGTAPEDETKNAKNPSTKSEDKNAAGSATKAALTLKTYDTASGVCLKYQTLQAAQVGRLVASLERLGRSMAAVPGGEDTSMPDVPLTEQGTGTNTPLPEAAGAAKDAKPAQGGAGGGGKKKKKGGKK